MALTNAQILKIVELFNKYSDSNVPIEVLDNLKELVNDAYSAFNDRQIKMSTMGADDVYSNRRVCFVKVIWKVLMEWLWNPTVIPAPSNVYGALYNWHAATYINNTNVINGLLYNWFAVNKVYDDWFLPSKDEMAYLITNLVPRITYGIKDAGYWTSSEGSATEVYVQDGNNPAINWQLTKDTIQWVRPIRAFTSDVMYAIGDIGPSGGYIFLTVGGNYYLETTLIDLDECAWSNIIDQATSGTGVEDGETNTLAIINQVGHTASAAKICDDLIVGVNNLAPTGWHVAEWTELNNLEVLLTISALKEVGTDHWLTNNGTDDYNFHLRGSGKRNNVGGFGDIKKQSSLWASTSWYSNPVFWTVFDNLISGWSIGNNYGCSVRCVKNSTTLSIGDIGTMVDYDGNVYPTICMPDGKEWMAVNLAVTHYTDGILIPEVINNAAWEALSTGARCAYSNDDSNVFETMEELAPTGWHVPTKTEFETLITFLGGEAIAGGALKETGFTYWDSPNAGATNSSGFSLQGSGIRGSEDGAFSSIKLYTVLLSNTEYILDTDQANDLEIPFDDDYAFIDAVIKGLGASLRLIKDSTTLSNGQSGVVTDIDGNIYPTICIGTQEWMAMNLNVTHYNNGTPIPNLTEDIDWINDLSGAMCWYNNNELQQ